MSRCTRIYAYDYKRNEFQYTLYPEDDPDMTFRTSLNTMRYKDAYGEVRSRSHIHGMVTEALGSDFDYLDYTMNVFEDIVARIEGALHVELGDLKVRSSVYDGEDYYFKDKIINK